MGIRWDEVGERGAGKQRFLGFTALTWGMAAPVAFITGAAVMSYFAQSHLQNDETPAPVAESAVSEVLKEEQQLAAEKAKAESEAKVAAAKAAALQTQVEALRNQVSDEARRREQAEQIAAEKSNELDRMQQAEPTVGGQVVGSVTPEVDGQPADTLPYAEPQSAATSSPALRIQAGYGEQAGIPASSASKSSDLDSGASEDSSDLQRIIEATASRSAALSDNKEDMGGETASAAASARSGKVPRGEAAVETALGRANGLESLSASDKGNLKAELVAGECVSTSLERVLGNPVPVVPLRSLVLDLDSEC